MPPGKSEAVPMFIVFPIYVSLVNQYGVFKSITQNRAFLKSRKPYCVGGSVGADPKGPSNFLIFEYM